MQSVEGVMSERGTLCCMCSQTEGMLSITVTLNLIKSAF